MYTNDVLTELHHSGLHELNGFRYLFQGNCPEGWNYVGLKGPTGYTTRQLKTCTHNITPTMGYRAVSRGQWTLVKELLRDPLVQAMLPLPKSAKAGTGVYFIDERKLPYYLELLACLERMSSPVHRAVRSWWGCRPTSLRKELEYSNLHPLIVHNVDQGDVQALRRLVCDASELPRSLIIVGKDVIFDKRVTVIDTLLQSYDLDNLIALPWEHIGTNLICNYCRFQPLETVVED